MIYWPDSPLTWLDLTLLSNFACCKSCKTSFVTFPIVYDLLSYTHYSYQTYQTLCYSKKKSYKSCHSFQSLHCPTMSILILSQSLNTSHWKYSNMSMQLFWPASLHTSPTNYYLLKYSHLYFSLPYTKQFTLIIHVTLILIFFITQSSYSSQLH